MFFKLFSVQHLFLEIFTCSLARQMLKTLKMNVNWSAMKARTIEAVEFGRLLYAFSAVEIMLLP